jgi:plastocyanin domain-containing protein
MTPVEWGVVAAGAGLIGLINWYFFFAPGPVAGTAASPAGFVEVPIVVRGGYAPSRIRVHAGDRVRLVFDRQETAGCSEEVVFPSFGIRRFLPPFEKTTIELRPEAPGEYPFTCGMSMLHGALIVDPA